ncbi:MAG TPA: 16S rRNA (cytosine(1402)-N(4))-methyltransferase RsmH [Thermomicrobiales bacterium]|nr:16S rRNA (cytosine(1402)-N(4))-methyltransferase RsmH [Thermomicrobiales bacterium]
MAGTSEPTQAQTAQILDSTYGHVTVLRHQAVAALEPFPGGVFVDGTFGGGGHTRQVFEVEPQVQRLIAIDADLDAVARAQEFVRQLAEPERFTFVRANFRDLGKVLADLGIESFDGLLLDLGVSSYQFDLGERGFSFRSDAPLDMRFDQTQGDPASVLVNTLPEAELADVIWRHGDERQSRKIASAIVRARAMEPVAKTFQLASIVMDAVGGRRGSPIHPATRTFQALRIAVNDELGALPDGLAAATDLLAPGGRLVVISFHSLEDRIVKRFIDMESRTCVCPPSQPVCTCDTVPRLKRVGKPIRPDEAEQRANPRSRSAIMRVAQRLDAGGVPVNRGHTK